MSVRQTSNDPWAPTIAVVTPMLNAENTIGRAVASVLAQVRQPDEILIIDDGSTDGSLARARSAGGDRVRLLTRQGPWDGGGNARNQAIAVAASEWIAFLDADDEWLPHHLDSLDPLIRGSDPDVGCVFSGFIIEEGGRVWPGPLTRVMGDHDVPMQLDLRAFAELSARLRVQPVSADSIIVRREVLTELGGFAGRHCPDPDGDMWIRVLGHSKAIVIPRAGSVFHRDAAWPSRVARNRTQRRCAVDALTRLLAFADKETTVSVLRLRNFYVLKHVRGVAGTAPITAMLYQDFDRSIDRLGYLEIRALAFLPVSAARWLHQLRVLHGVLLSWTHRWRRRLSAGTR